MSRRHKYAIEKPKGGTWRIFTRLMRRFAKPYWWVMMIGVFSTLIIGGAMASALRVMDVSFDVFESGTNSEYVSPAQASAAEEVTAAEIPAAPADKSARKISQAFHKVNSVLERVGLDPIEESDTLNSHTVFLLLSLLVGFFGLQAVGELINRYSLKWLGSRVVVDMRTSLFEHFTNQSLGFFTRSEVGALISRCTNDINAVEGLISSSFPELCTAPVFIIVALEFICSKAISLGLGMNFLLLLIAVPVCIVPIYLLSRLLRRYQVQVLKGISNVTSKMQESFSGIQVVKTFNQEEREVEQFKVVNEKFFARLRKAIMADVMIHPSMQFSALVLAAFFVLICYHYDVSLGALAILGFAAQQAYKPIKDLAKINASFQKCAAAAERVFEVLDMDTTLPLPANPKPISAFNHEIVYRDVSFAYTPGADPVLSNIDLTIRKGELVALVGQTGSGKTTLANLLARFYDPTEGTVTIDGVDLKELAIPDFRRMVGLVSQDIFLFNTSILENIRYGRPDATEAEVRKVAEQANAMEFIEKLPGGFDYVVGERGCLLSGGQKQRIAIARAMLRNPPVLILDEATSALDTVTEQLVQAALNNVMRERTVLVIAHRLSTIQNANNILVMERGRVIEHGTHRELLAMNGQYRKLHNLQFSEKGNE